MLVQLVQCLWVMFMWLFYIGLMSKNEPTLNQQTPILNQQLPLLNQRPFLAGLLILLTEPTRK